MGAVLRRAVPSTAQHRCWEILNTVVLFICGIAGMAAQAAWGIGCNAPQYARFDGGAQPHPWQSPSEPLRPDSVPHVGL
ncbi:hypothetical protein GCM10027590_12580 [Nocardiopsis nanhaiensis]